MIAAAQVAVERVAGRSATLDPMHEAVGPGGDDDAVTVTTARRVDVAERRARLGRRHHLARASAEPLPALEDVARDLVGLHGTDPAAAYIAAAARTGLATPEQISEVLYEQRRLVRMLGMRRTMFYLPRDLMPVVQSACTDALAVRERTRLMTMLADSGIARDPKRWFARVERRVLKAIEERGEATAKIGRA